MKEIISISIIIFLVTVLSLAQIMTRSETNTTGAEGSLAIEKANLQWEKAWEKGKPELIVELFAKDGKQLLNNGKIVKGHAPLLEFYQNAVKGAEKEIKTIKVSDSAIKTWLDTEKVNEKENIIISILKIESGLLKQSNISIFTLWKKQKDGNWRITLATGIFKEPFIKMDSIDEKAFKSISSQ